MNRYVISLPAGLPAVRCGDIPLLIARALHPSKKGESRKLTYLVRVAKPGATKEAIKWNGWPIEDADRVALGDIWKKAGLSDLTLPIPESEWAPYLKAFQRFGKDLDWMPDPVFVTPEFQADIKRHGAVKEHKKRLMQDVMSGNLKALHPETHIQISMYLENALVPIVDFKSYVSQFLIDVVMEGDEYAGKAFRLPSVQGKREYDRRTYEVCIAEMQNRRDNGRFTLEEAALEIEKNTGERADDMLEKLLRAAKSNVLPVYEPGKVARWQELEKVRHYYQEAYADDLNDWLAKNEPRLPWKFKVPAVCATTSSSATQDAETEGTQSSAVLQSVAGESAPIFQTMENLNPGEVTINFVKGESGTTVLSITARGTTRRVLLGEIGLADNRTGGMNTQGGLLLALAGTKKLIHHRKRAKQMSRLRQSLKDYFGFKINPVKYSDKQGYRPLFIVSDKRDAADKRAAQEAERRTLSFEDAHHRPPDGAEFDDGEGDDASKWLKEAERNDDNSRS